MVQVFLGLPEWIHIDQLLSASHNEHGINMFQAVEIKLVNDFFINTQNNIK